MNQISPSFLSPSIESRQANHGFIYPSILITDLVLITRQRVPGPPSLHVLPRFVGVRDEGVVFVLVVVQSKRKRCLFWLFLEKWPIHEIGQYWRLQQFQKNRPRFLSSPWTILLISIFAFCPPKHLYGTAVRPRTNINPSKIIPLSYKNSM